ncbi:MAG: hypothetical protein J6I85_09045 [Clostridia bacterium]|nr:hypothetical protein [Clostridia bacterium]
MLKLKGHKGITLIALIITIIVLLILAGVTIAQITSQDSAPQKAADSKVENEAGAARDEATMLATKYIQEYMDKKYVQNIRVEETTSNVQDKKVEVGKEGNSLYKVSGVELPKMLTDGEETLPALVGDYVAQQFATRASSEGTYNYNSTTGRSLKIKNSANEDLASGTINDDGTITWDGNTSGGNEQGESNLSQAEKTALTTNGMAELTAAQIDADTSLTSDQKTALKDTSKVKAVLSGNVPVPVGYTYLEGTSTALKNKPDEGNWGVVVADAAGNEWVWVPVNANESIAPENMYVENEEGWRVGEQQEKNTYLELTKKINGLKIASINNLPSLKVASSSSSSSSSSEDSGPIYYTNVTTTKKGASNILREYGETREDPMDEGYREPAVMPYDANNGLREMVFEDLEEMAKKFVSDYEEMIESITKYGGFFIGRYELSGIKKGYYGMVTDMKIQSGQQPIVSVDWYDLYEACTKLGTSTTTSTMIWGTQWDVVCRWAEDSGDLIAPNHFLSVPGDGSIAKSGTNLHDVRNNIYDFATNCLEWTQEASGTGCRVARGGNTAIHHQEISSAVWRVSISCDDYYYSELGTRPTLYIK